MDILYARSFHRSSHHPSFSHDDKTRCLKAVEMFRKNPFHQSLNYERLGSDSRQNHCSIRASQELRVIMAVAPADFQKPKKVVLLNMGHHDQVYKWAKRQGYYSDTQDAVNPQDVMPRDGASTKALSDTLNFEEWQVFLHPDQVPLVRRHYTREARIRGAAGTGKTVVALHRAVELGRRFTNEQVLFTTFSRSLTEHLRQLYKQMPDAPNNVKFYNIDRIAKYVIQPPSLNPQKVDAAFDTAYEAVIPGTVLARCNREYLKAEIDKIIKGRATSRDEYLDTDRFERLGRKRGFRRADRELCWRLREVWDEEMRKVGTTSFADVLIAARDQMRQRDSGEYRAVIVDEAQDMTLVGMQFVRALVAGKPENPVPPDGLLILDDAAQRIYTGGFRLGWAGLQVTGQSDILRTNYRNTKPIVELAKAVRGNILPVKEDNDDGAALHAEFEQKEGPLPVLIQVAPNAEVSTIANKIQELVNNEGMPHEAIGVLTRFNADADQVSKELKEKFNIPCTQLKNLREGSLCGGVRVGTFDRSKGLEFRTVFIPRLGASVFLQKEGDEYMQQTIPGIQDVPRETTDEEREDRQLDLDRLYVGMTRAKERLYLIADEAPFRELDEARDLFEQWRHGVGGTISSTF